MTTLQRAFAFAERPHFPFSVGEDLKLDVLRALDEFFQVHVGISKSRFGFATRGEKARFHFVFVTNDAHAASAAAAGRFQDDGKSDALGFFDRVRRIAEDFAAGQKRQTEALCVAARGDFVSPRAHRFWRWPDETQATFFADARELGILRQKSVARVNRFGRGDLRSRNDRGDVQITFRRGGGSDANGFVGEANVERARIGFGVNGDAANAELFARAHDPKRDLPAIRDENLLKHAQAFLMRKSF